MGDKPMHQEGVGLIPPQGGLQADREESSAREVRRVDIPPTGGRDGGVGPAGGGDLHFLVPEHSLAVHFGQANYGPVSGGRAETGATGIQAVVVSIQGRCGGYAEGGSGGGMNSSAC